jgi:hypothetical protein
MPASKYFQEEKGLTRPILCPTGLVLANAPHGFKIVLYKLKRKTMKTIKILGLTTGFIITVLCLAALIGQDNVLAKKSISKANNKGFVVLELFTSEGCSSCPPADELLAKIQQETQGKDVYVLAYHVDYWNRQGWKDVFSSADFSNRQIQYGHWFGGTQIYTPQVIVNGKSEFVGSDEVALRNAITEQLTTKSSTTLALQAHQDGEKLIVQYQSASVFKGSRLQIAIVQKAAQNKVERGENAGHTLSHVQIVRKLQNEPLSATGNGNSVVVLPKGFNTQNWEVVGLVQDQSNGEILAAAKANLNVAVSAAK